MISRDKLTLHLHEFLECANFNDYAPNGVQVEGKEDIKRICTAVTASSEVIEHAIAMQADALIVHHGYFWRGEEPVLTGMKRQRIAKLLTQNISLLAYHLPLDCHPDIGNNACLAKLLDIKTPKMHWAGKTPNLIWSGVIKDSKTPNEFLLQLEDVLGRRPLLVEGSNKPVQSIAWCSGAAQDFIEDAYKLGVDTYISGEISERTYYQAKELGIHYFSCGHHATERYGIQALGSYLASHFKLDHHFIDSANPV
ncbi:Nif3-like dinuclear metal center hexameric protein [Legionella hackeliae]|uniref:GTP cyclohydrolase 1 type 2 homolog n=1 Tax=Legionella hackeliae TaxID=449 RepID=A0A0A8UQZ1_LEGHA|nr:Nif3-like dinuclear metal center hexameric protein [Legionella hackeliae]KTD09565.1 putative NIF3-like protein 1 [Legionella hackeliae]CEK11118.1 putative NIF3-like protein 1 [Legionella hackeliae]STX47870.1 putative NIF3-like protein 1 [Legionella hackeliae]